MDNFSVDTGTTQAVSEGMRSISSELRTQISETERLISLQKQLRSDVLDGRKFTGGGGRRQRSSSGDPFDDLELQDSRDLSLASSTRKTPQDNKAAFEKMFDNTFNRRIDQWKARFAPAAAIENVDHKALTIRQLGHAPHELLQLLSGDIGMRGARGLTHLAGAAAQGAGLQGIAGLASSASGLFGPLMAGVAGAGALLGFMHETMGPNAERMREGQEQMERFQRAFSGDPGQDLRRNETTLGTPQDKRESPASLMNFVFGIGRSTDKSQEELRTEKLAQRLSANINFKSQGRFSIFDIFNGNNVTGVELDVKRRAAVVEQLSKDVPELQKHSFLGSVFLNQEFKNINTAGATMHMNFGANDNFGAAIEDLSQRGANGWEIAQRVARAAGATAIAVKRDQEERDAMEHDPARMFKFQQTNATIKAADQRYLMTHMQWNED